MDLPWIPPELREDRGEIEAASSDELPRLVELEDIMDSVLLSAAAASEGHPRRQAPPGSGGANSGRTIRGVEVTGQRVTVARAEGRGSGAREEG